MASLHVIVLTDQLIKCYTVNKLNDINVCCGSQPHIKSTIYGTRDMDISCFDLFSSQ